MSPETDEIDEIDLSLTNAILTLYNAGASRSQAERALQERIGIMFDAIDEWDELTLVERYSPQEWRSAQRMKYRH